MAVYTHMRSHTNSLGANLPLGMVQVLRERRKKEMSVKQLSPTFQAVLNKQLAKVTDALDVGEPIDAFIKIRTLILLLNPSDKKEFMENDVAHIHAEVNQAMKTEGVDLYMTRRKRTSQVKHTLRKHLLELFSKVMTKLHEGKYLEASRKPVTSNVPPEFFAQQPQ